MFIFLESGHLGIHFLELCISLLRGLQSFGISFTHEAVFFEPPMEGCYRYLLLPTEFFLVQIPTVGRSQQADDFFWLIPFLLHSESFCLFKTSHSLWASFSGGGQHNINAEHFNLPPDSILQKEQVSFYCYGGCLNADLRASSIWLSNSQRKCYNLYAFYNRSGLDTLTYYIVHPTDLPANFTGTLDEIPYDVWSNTSHLTFYTVNQFFVLIKETIQEIVYTPEWIDRRLLHQASFSRKWRYWDDRPNHLWLWDTRTTNYFTTPVEPPLLSWVIP